LFFLARPRRSLSFFDAILSGLNSVVNHFGYIATDKLTTGSRLPESIRNPPGPLLPLFRRPLCVAAHRGLLFFRHRVAQRMQGPNLQSREHIRSEIAVHRELGFAEHEGSSGAAMPQNRRSSRHFGASMSRA
jgi:hypothetical protein